ncbi:hypothetical protein B0H14DRAFT_3459777 [Mycena olivaceomarginata]|nr:hypothetical protein B0H14DRAFT_3459777 [Mycena olivaceomarginata]
MPNGGGELFGERRRSRQQPRQPQPRGPRLQIDVVATRAKQRDEPPESSSPTRQASSSTRDPDESEEDSARLQSLANIGSRGRKRAAPVRTVQGLGRGIRKLASLFGDITHIISEARAYEKNPYPEDHGIDEASLDVTEEELQWLDKKRGQVSHINRAPSSEPYSPSREDVSSSDARLLHLMQKGANDARSDDVKRITSFVGTWLNEDRDRPELRVFDHTRNATITNADGETVVTEQRAPILNPGDRSTRGIQHDITGALLTPTHWDWSEASVRQDLRAATKKLGFTLFFRVFYEDFKGDPKKAERGFLKSRYLVKTYKVVFTAPSSADNEDDENTPPLKKLKSSKAVRKSVADILGLNGKVTPSLHCLCRGTLLGRQITTTSPSRCYNDFIVDFFEDTEEGSKARQRADNLLTWWNRKVFPTIPPHLLRTIAPSLPGLY